jgi:hypothetical protein
MVIDVIRELNRTSPFKPYSIRLASGVIHSVPHPDFIAIAPRGSWVMVSDEEERPHWINALLIEDVTPLPEKSQAK